MASNPVATPTADSKTLVPTDRICCTVISPLWLSDEEPANCIRAGWLRCQLRQKRSINPSCSFSGIRPWRPRPRTMPWRPTTLEPAAELREDATASRGPRRKLNGVSLSPKRRGLWTCVLSDGKRLRAPTTPSIPSGQNWTKYCLLRQKLDKKIAPWTN